MRLETIDVSAHATAVPFDYADANAARRGFDHGQSIVDVVSAIVGVLLTLLVAAPLMVLNPVFNPGPLFYRQARMGRGGRKFMMWKFRTMLVPELDQIRRHDAPLEVERVTILGRILRKTRIDELPNFINVWNGEMSLIGPRPDAFDHAMVYSRTVRGYANRFSVRPGITGLAQVRGGYADNMRAVERKARFDRFYVKNTSPRMDAYIALQTVRVMITGFGAK